MSSTNHRENSQRVFLLGATGTIGRATARALVEAGHEVVCLVRAPMGPMDTSSPQVSAERPSGIDFRLGDVTDPKSLARDGFRGESFDTLVSCLASRTGRPKDAWAIDHQAHLDALAAAKDVGVGHVVLLSAICVQKPVLAFQMAKRAFEKALMASGLSYSIVRPTAFFKSLSGQIDRVKKGKPYLLFGDGRLTACKPISDEDVAAFMTDCVTNPERRNRILPIGGPGEAITPRQQGEHLFALLGQTEKFRHLPIGVLDAAIGTLSLLGRGIPSLADKAELARIGRYYATESMLVLDPVSGLYDAEATPSVGTDTLFDFYARVVKGQATVDRGDHAVF